MTGDEHRWCYAEFHRCDGGGPGEFYAYTDNKQGRLRAMSADAENSGTPITGTAKKKPRGRAFKPGQSGNPKGRPVERRSMRKVFADVLDDKARERIAHGFIERAAKGSLEHYEVILREIGEAIDRPNPNDPALLPDGQQHSAGIFNLNLGDDAVRTIAQQFFVALAMGQTDARQPRELRDERSLEAPSPPDAG